MVGEESNAEFMAGSTFGGTQLFVLYLCLAAVLILSQVYISIYMYKQERSIWWALIGGLLPFGLNIYLYQIFKFEKQIGYNFDHVPPQQRRSWRVMYTLALSQFMLLFVLIGWLTSP